MESMEELKLQTIDDLFSEISTGENSSKPENLQKKWQMNLKLKLIIL